MKKLIVVATAAAALALTGTAAAALAPWTFVGPGAACSPTSTFSNGVLHLSKPCTTATNASAGATITGVNGQTFTSASFTLASAAQCQGGSPRFNVVTNVMTFFLGCNNVSPTINANGSATYTFTAATIAAGGNQVPVPTGTISAVDVLIDVQGTADLSDITFNGKSESLVIGGPTSKSQCKRGGWKSFTSPSFKNQGRCISWFEHHVRGHGNGQGKGQGQSTGRGKAH
jgi:hypothetical protein